MQSRQLIINDTLTDLSDEQPIAITFQVNDLANIKDRQSAYTNTVKIPKSATNRRIMGYSDSDAFAQNEPYIKLNAKIVQNGVEVFINSRAIIESAGDNFSLNIFSGLRGFNDLINNVKLNDLPIDAGVFFNNPEEAAKSQSNTYGVIKPVVDYGQLNNSANIDTPSLRPMWFHRYVMAGIELLTGYTFKGAIINDPLYLTELVSVAGDGSDFEHLPDMYVKDFLKDWMQRYFLTPVVDNQAKTITFNSFDLLYSNKPIAKDWTDKFIDSTVNTSFTIGNYAQLNTLKYKADENVTAGLGDSSFNIANENIDEEYAAVQSVFGATESVLRLGNLPVSLIRKVTITDGTYVETLPRVLYNRILINETGGNFIYKAAGLPDYAYPLVAIPYFIGNGGNDLSFNSLLSRYGTGLLRLLSKVRVSTREVLLSELDVKDLDHFIPVYDSRTAQYYYINKINNWQPGKPCKVTLIKM